MDFDSSFYDCCKSCNSIPQKYKWPRSGQGDCKCSGEVQESNFWVHKATNENKFKNKIFQESHESAFKKDKEKKLMDPGCNCLIRTNQKHEYKVSHEPKQEKNKPEIFTNTNFHTNFQNLSSNNWKSKMGRFYVPEEQKYHSLSEKLLSENIFELEKKVNFILQELKDREHKHISDNHYDNTQTKGAATLEDAWQMFNFNRRLSVAEEGIEKLALILEELLKELCENRGLFINNENTNSSESSAYGDVTVGQKLNCLKNRNNILLILMKTFLKSSSVEEIFSKLSKEFEYQPSAVGGKKWLKDCSREEMIGKSDNLHVEGRDMKQQKKTQNYCEDLNRKIGKRHFESKHLMNKLEAISEQAELAMCQNEGNENIINSFESENETRNFTQKRTQIGEYNKTGPELSEKASRLLVQEAILKSSLDKAQLELFSKLDSCDKNYPKVNMNILKTSQIEEDNIPDLNFDSFSDRSSFYENQTVEKGSTNGMTQILSKYLRHEEQRNSIKEERNSFGGNSNGLTKDTAVKKKNEQLNKKNKFNHKIISKNTCFALGSGQKTNQSNQSIPVTPTPPRKERNKFECQIQETRPVTVPTPHRKLSTVPAFKSPPPEITTRKNSGINNNVRMKNKILLSKKSFVQTP